MDTRNAPASTVRTQIKRNVFSFVTMSWMSPTLSLGYKRPLQEDDLPDLSNNDKAESIAKVLDGFWAQLRAHSANPQQVKPPSLFTTLALSYIGYFTSLFFISALTVTANILIPLLVPQIITAILVGPDAPGLLIANVYGLAGLFFAANLVLVLLRAAETAVDLNFTMSLRAVIIDAIFGKSLRLSPKARGEFSAGKINSLVDADADTVINFPPVLLMLIGGIVQIVIGLYFLGRVLGVATWVTIGVFFFFFFFVLAMGPIQSAAIDDYMEIMDLRTRKLREFLYGVKIIKYQAAEEFFHSAILGARAQQLAALRRFIVPLNFITAGLVIQQTCIAPISIIAYAGFGNEINSSNIFGILALLQAVCAPTFYIGEVFTDTLQFFVSYKRVSAFLIAPEIQDGEITAMLAEDQSDDGSAIKMDGAAFTWEIVEEESDMPDTPAQQGDKKDAEPAPALESAIIANSNDASFKAIVVAVVSDTAEATKQEPFKLEDVNLSIPRGSLVAVVGSVGSGKSSFLSALIGGMRKTAGSSSVFGSVAYCAQEPWILTGTIEENIVFSDESVRPNIAKAVSASCLEHDLEILPNGLGTQIGEKGINLSGGQKARVALARAIARDADIYLLDDPIAALDAHVGKKVFDEAICGTLKSKTVVLVTHQLHLLPKVDFVVVLDNGRVAETGTFKDLMAVPESALSGIMKDYHFDDEDNKDDEEDKDEDEVVVKAVKEFEEQQAIAEDRRVGALKFAYVRGYFLAAGPLYFGLLVLILALTMAANALSQISLVLWTGNCLSWPDSSYLSLFIGASLGDVIIGLAQIVITFACCVSASRTIHNVSLAGLIRAPMSFFDGQPIGRILNRMTADVRLLDLVMSQMFVNFFFGLCRLSSSVIIMIYTSPYLLILLVIIFLASIVFMRFFLASYREIKRLSSILASPLASHLSETLNGIPTINAYGAQSKFIVSQQVKMDMSNKSNLLLESTQFWLGLRLEVLTSTITLVLLILAANGLISGGVASVGLALTVTIDIGPMLNMVLMFIGKFEAAFNSVERLDYYANELPREAPRLLPNDPATKDEWPTAGALAIRDLQICYDSRPDHAVIKNLSLSIRPGEKVGIVGRTGSGKSTLMTALFRIMEASKGSITIDGRDIATLGLKTLRSRLQIIPQEPVLFKGTVRSNLDMLQTGYSDDQLWESLLLVGLKDYVAAQTDKLDAAIEENGSNLSMGQRQLLCLAKAILARPKVLIMDEATASVDAEADKRIQESIRSQFADTTVLSIAHRLNTIAAFDRVLVLDQGEIAEFDAPHVLLGRAGSVFGELVDATGAANAAVIREIASGHFNASQV